MREMFAGYRFLVMPHGAATCIGVCNEQQGVSAMQEIDNKEFQELVKYRVVKPNPAGSAADIMSVADLMGQILGIHGVSYFGQSVQVRDSGIVVPDRRLILPH